MWEQIGGENTWRKETGINGMVTNTFWGASSFLLFTEYYFEQIAWNETGEHAQNKRKMQDTAVVMEVVPPGI